MTPDIYLNFGTDASIHTRGDIHCLPYAGFFFNLFWFPILGIELGKFAPPLIGPVFLFLFFLQLYLSQR